MNTVHQSSTHYLKQCHSETHKVHKLFSLDKDDMFVREDLLLGKYHLDIGGIIQDEQWPEYSYWSGGDSM